MRAKRVFRRHIRLVGCAGIADKLVDSRITVRVEWRDSRGTFVGVRDRDRQYAQRSGQYRKERWIYPVNSNIFTVQLYTRPCRPSSLRRPIHLSLVPSFPDPDNARVRPASMLSKALSGKMYIHVVPTILRRRRCWNVYIVESVRQEM